MNLLQVRTKFREFSGRHDLVNADYSDNGADFFLNEGRKFLDRLDETKKSWGICYRFIQVGRYSTTFPYCRAIKEVWVATTNEDEGRWQLEKKNLQDLTAGYLTGFPSARTNGTPLYYSPGIGRHIPEDVAANEMEAYAGFVDVMAAPSHEYNAILINVPTDKKLMVEIRGLFYSHELVNDTDTNYWSEVHPLLLIMSAMRYIEVVNRNTQGVNDWTNAIMVDMKQIGSDLVEELIAEADEMGE